MNSPRPAEAPNCLITSLALIAMAGKAIYTGGRAFLISLRQEALSGWQSGCRELGKTVSHLPKTLIETTQPLCEVAAAAFRELGSLPLCQEWRKSVNAAGVAACEGAALVQEAVMRPAHEVAQLCRSGGREVVKTGHAAVESAGEGARALIAPARALVRELLTLTLALETEKTANAAHGAAREGGSLLWSAARAWGREAGEAAVAGARQTSQAGRAALFGLEESTRTTRETALALIAEMIVSMRSGGAETRKFSHQLPPAVRDALRQPMEGFVSLITEAILSLQSGALETRKTASGALAAAQEGRALIEGTVWGFVTEGKESGRALGVETMKTALAAQLALIEGSRPPVAFARALCEEIVGLCLSREPKKAAFAGAHALVEGMLMSVHLGYALALQTVDLLVSGIRQTGLTIGHGILAAGELPTEPVERLTREAIEAVEAGMRQTGSSAIHGVDAAREGLQIPYAFAEAIVRETVELVLSGEHERVKTDAMMRDGMPGVWYAHVVYPVEDWVVPKVDAIRNHMHERREQIRQRIQQLRESIAAQIDAIRARMGNAH